MTNNKYRISVFAAAAMCFVSSITHAAGISGTGSLPATPAGGALIDFNNLSTGTLSNPLTIGGVSFTGSSGLTGYNSGGLYNSTGVSLLNTGAGSYRFDFASGGSTTFFFNYGGTNTTWTLRAYSATNQLIATANGANINAAANGEYVGVSGSEAVKYATFTGDTAGDVIIIDNFVYNLLTGPSAADTLLSMQGNATVLRKFFALQGSYVNPGLSYDCAMFDSNGVCASFSGRYSSTTGSGPEATSGVLTAAYRVNPNVRIGAFIEQYATDITSGGVRMSNTNPDLGVFGVWSQTETGEGFKVRAAYRYGNHGLSITRDAIGSAEAGSGNSDLTTQGAQLTLSKGYQLNSTVLASPYVGVRYTNIKRNGYTESASATVTAPLTYDTLKQESTSLLLGVNVAAQVASAVTVTGSVGVETDTSQKISNYTASGVADLGSIQFNNDTRRTRAVASAGVAYKIAKTQQVSAQVFYREEAFGSTSTATGMLTYAAGF